MQFWRIMLTRQMLGGTWIIFWSEVWNLYPYIWIFLKKKKKKKKWLIWLLFRNSQKLGLISYDFLLQNDWFMFSFFIICKMSTPFDENGTMSKDFLSKMNPFEVHIPLYPYMSVPLRPFKVCHGTSFQSCS